VAAAPGEHHRASMELDLHRGRLLSAIEVEDVDVVALPGLAAGHLAANAAIGAATGERCRGAPERRSESRRLRQADRRRSDSSRCTTASPRRRAQARQRSQNR
jgi:hypothetical protein